MRKVCFMLILFVVAMSHAVGVVGENFTYTFLCDECLMVSNNPIKIIGDNVSIEFSDRCLKGFIDNTTHTPKVLNIISLCKPQTSVVKVMIRENSNVAGGVMTRITILFNGSNNITINQSMSESVEVDEDNVNDLRNFLFYFGIVLLTLLGLRYVVGSLDR